MREHRTQKEFGLWFEEEFAGQTMLGLKGVDALEDWMARTRVSSAVPIYELLVDCWGAARGASDTNARLLGLLDRALPYLIYNTPKDLVGAIWAEFDSDAPAKGAK